MPDTIYRGYLIHRQSPGEGDSFYPYEVVAPGGDIVTWEHTIREAKQVIDGLPIPPPSPHATQHTDRT